MRVHHIALGVKDLEESVRFYKDNLGFKEIQHFTKPGWKGKAAIIELGETRLELFHFDEMKKGDTSQDFNVIGMRHIGIQVDDVDAKQQELKAKGIDIDDPQKGTTCEKFCFFRDPNGIPLELYQAKKSI